MTHPQLQARKPIAEAPDVAEIFEKVVARRLAAVDSGVSFRIGVLVAGPEPLEYVIDFANGRVHGGDEWRAVSEDPDLDVVVEIDGEALRAAMTHGVPPTLTVVRGEVAAFAPLVALMRSASA